MIGLYDIDAIYTGDSRELSKAIPDGSIDLIFTDPPYLKEFLPLYGWLASESERVLKPGGFLMAYCGNYWKAEIYKYLFQTKLDYFWDFFELHAGMGMMVWDRRTIARGKSIICFSKGKGLPRTNVLSVWTGGGNEKQYHTWGQSESTARYYIDCFSKPGDIVFDPFCGGGTTPTVAKMIGRHYLAFEIDPENVEISMKRVAGSQMMMQEIWNEAA